MARVCPELSTFQTMTLFYMARLQFTQHSSVKNQILQILLFPLLFSMEWSSTSSQKCVEFLETSALLLPNLTLANDPIQQIPNNVK